MVLTMNRKEKIEKILKHRTKKPYRGQGSLGQKKGIVCPHCGGHNYDFYGRFKHCSRCGYDTLGERKLSWIRWHLKRDRGAEIGGTDLELCIRYIDSLN